MDLPNMASPRDDSQQLQVQAYKKGDIVWVRYRNKEYLGKINAYYPKERKVTHIWFPLNRSSVKQSAIFKASLSKVRPFSLNDELPGDASEELQYSFDQVNRLLTTGITEEELIEEFEQSKAEQEAAKQKTGSAKRKSTADLLKKVTGGTAKSTPKTPKSAGKAKEMPQKQPLAPVFQPGEQIIVDTPHIGMWPGIFESYVEGHPDTIHYSLFPRKTSQEVLIGQKDSIVPFPLDHIEGMINEGNVTEMLMEALRDTLAYVRERIAHNAGSSKQQPSTTVARMPKETKNQQESVTPKEENIQQTQSVTAEKQKTLTSASAAGRLKEEIIEMETDDATEGTEETAEEKAACEKAEKEARGLEKAKEKFDRTIPNSFSSASGGGTTDSSFDVISGVTSIASMFSNAATANRNNSNGTFGSPNNNSTANSQGNFRVFGNNNKANDGIGNGAFYAGFGSAKGGYPEGGFGFGGTPKSATTTTLSANATNPFIAHFEELNRLPQDYWLPKKSANTNINNNGGTTTKNAASPVTITTNSATFIPPMFNAIYNGGKNANANNLSPFHLPPQNSSAANANWANQPTARDMQPTSVASSSTNIEPQGTGASIEAAASVEEAEDEVPPGDFYGPAPPPSAPIYHPAAVAPEQQVAQHQGIHTFRGKNHQRRRKDRKRRNAEWKAMNMNNTTMD